MMMISGLVWAGFKLMLEDNTETYLVKAKKVRK